MSIPIQSNMSKVKLNYYKLINRKMGHLFFFFKLWFPALNTADVGFLDI